MSMLICVDQWFSCSHLIYYMHGNIIMHVVNLVWEQWAVVFCGLSSVTKFNPPSQPCSWRWKMKCLEAVHTGHAWATVCVCNTARCTRKRMWRRLALRLTNSVVYGRRLRNARIRILVFNARMSARITTWQYRKVACTDMYGPYPNSGPYTSGHSRILLKVAIAIGPGCVYGIVYCPDTRTGDLWLFDWIVWTTIRYSTRAYTFAFVIGASLSESQGVRSWCLLHLRAYVRTCVRACVRTYVRVGEACLGTSGSVWLGTSEVCTKWLRASERVEACLGTSGVNVAENERIDGELYSTGPLFKARIWLVSFRLVLRLISG